jgi:hypothetical protein
MTRPPPAATLKVLRLMEDRRQPVDLAGLKSSSAFDIGPHPAELNRPPGLIHGDG